VEPEGLKVSQRPKTLRGQSVTFVKFCFADTQRKKKVDYG